MKYEPADAHPCGSCLRWPECNGVEWPRCQDPKEDNDLQVHMHFGPFPLDAPRIAVVLAETEKRRKRGRIL